MRARHGVGHGVEPNRQVQIGAVLATQYRQATDPRSSPTSALFPAAIRPGIASATESPSPLQRQAHHQIKFRRIDADSRRHRHLVVAPTLLKDLGLPPLHQTPIDTGLVTELVGSDTSKPALS